MLGHFWILYLLGGERRSDCLYYLLHEELVVRQGIEEKYASSTINILTLFTYGLYACKTIDSLIAD